MAGFHKVSFVTHDDYMSPKIMWENIKDFIPQDKVLWEAFYGDGKSGEYLRELGFDVIHEEIDFFDDETLPQYDILVSNPPFSKCKEVVGRLKKLEKPFIIVLPAFKLFTKYFRDAFQGENIQLIIPKKRIQFEKIKNGVKKAEGRCSFDCFYYCWKMGFDRDIIWLE